MEVWGYGVKQGIPPYLHPPFAFDKLRSPGAKYLSVVRGEVCPATRAVGAPSTTTT